jgi:hypothetical protein
LWHGQSLVFTVAFLTVVIAVGYLLEAVLLAVDVYAQMEKTCETARQLGLDKWIPGEEGNSGTLLEFLRTNRLSATSCLSPEEIDQQILESGENSRVYVLLFIILPSYQCMSPFDISVE